MKRNLMFALSMLLVLGLTAGCSLFGGNNDSVTATTTAAVANVSGAIALGGGNTIVAGAPGRNLAPIVASALEVRAYVDDTDVTTQVGAVAVGGTFTGLKFPVTTTGSNIFIRVIHKTTGMIILQKFLGKVAVPAAVATAVITNLAIDQPSTVQAVVVKPYLATITQPIFVILATNNLANVPVPADTVVTNLTTAITNAGGATAAALVTLTTTVATNANYVVVTVTPILTGFTTVVPPTVDPVVTTAVTNAVKISTVETSADGTTWKTIYSNGTITNQALTFAGTGAYTPYFKVTFSGAVTVAGTPKIMATITDSIGSATKTVGYNVTGTDMTWAQAFGVNPTLATGQTNFTFQVSATAPYKIGYANTGYATSATVTLTGLTFEGITAGGFNVIVPATFGAVTVGR